jgi:predicted dehydrogenase
LRVLVGNSLQDGFLDYAGGPGLVEILVTRMITIRRVSGLYFERPRSLRLVANYVREIGLASTAQKVLSRSAERYRNEKYLSIGSGVATASDGGKRAVLFIAPRHPRCVDRLVLPEAMVADSADDQVIGTVESIYYVDRSADPAGIPDWLDALAGWDAESGESTPAIDWAVVKALCSGTPAGQTIATPPESPTGDAVVPAVEQGRMSGTLFGYGNYAKTVILPNLPKDLVVSRIHEIDPLQVPRKRDPGVTWSTSPELASDDQGKVVFIAGYHHSHGPLAAEALARVKDCVVEKPLVTSREQLQFLEQALANSSGRYFACFQKRYSRFNAWARSDLGVKLGEPINYHAIVYEVPLPDKHWYRWPNSRSRLVSNGCHWVDHFLFMNDWSTPETWNVQAGSDGTLSAFVSLRNGACMTLTLTDIGSERIGVQDHIQLRAGQVTVRLSNDSEYIAEDSSRILRRTRINKMATYRDMYVAIGQKIVAGSPGDSRESILGSSSLVLALEEALSH